MGRTTRTITLSLPQEMVDKIEELMKASKIPVVAESVLAKWQPRGEDLENCAKLGKAVAACMKTV